MNNTNNARALALIRQLVPIIRAVRARYSLAGTACSKAHEQAINHYKRNVSGGVDRYGVPVLVSPPTKAMIARNRQLRANVGRLLRAKRRLGALHDKLLNSCDDLSWTRNNGYKITPAMLARAEARIAEWKTLRAELR